MTAPFLGGLFLLPALFFWRETLGKRTLGDQDAIFWFFPAYRFVADQVREWRLPLWNPDYYSGVPLFAQWQAGMLDPINWVHLVGSHGPDSFTLTLSLELSFSLSLIGLFLYSREIGLTRRAAAFAAVVYSLSGFAVARTLYPGLLHIHALTPLVVLAIERLHRRRRWRDAALGSLIVAWQVMAAHPQPLIYSSLLAVAYALHAIFFRRDGAGVVDHWRGRLRSLLQFGTIFLLGGAIAAVQLIPAFEIARASVRQEWPFEMFTLHSIHPASLLTTLIPFFHGGGRGAYGLPYWGISWHHNESQIYIGILALSLATAGAFVAARMRDPLGIFWAAVATVGTILVLGRYSGPVARLLFHFPLISHFRSPNRHWMEVSLALAILAGYAVDRLLRDDADAPLFTRWASLFYASLVLTVGGLVLSRRDIAEQILRSLPDWQALPESFLTGAGREFAIPMVVAALTVILLLLWLRSTRRAKWYPLIFALLITDYYLYSASAPITHPGGIESQLGRALPASFEGEAGGVAPYRSHILLSPREGEFSPFWFSGHSMVTGYDPLLNGRYKNFSGIDEAGRTYLASMVESRDRTLDLLNTRYLLLPRDWRPSPPTPVAPLELTAGHSLLGEAHTPKAGTLFIRTAGNGSTSGRLTIQCGEAPFWMAPLPSGAGENRWDLPGSILGCTDRKILTIYNTGASSIHLAEALLIDPETGAEERFLNPNSASRLDEHRWRDLQSPLPPSPYTGYRLVENLQVLPRVWMVDRVEAAYDGDQLKLIRGEIRDSRGQLFDPQRVALVTQTDSPESQWFSGYLGDRDAAERDLAGTATIVRQEPDRLVVATDSTRPSILVLSELANSGWRASVDGHSADWHRVDYTLRGLPLPAGHHEVEFLYRPDSIKIGAAISLIAALITTTILFKSRLRDAA